MKTFYKIICVIFALSVLGGLIRGQLFVFGAVMALLFAFLGWRNKSEKNKAH